MIFTIEELEKQIKSSTDYYTRNNITDPERWESVNDLKELIKELKELEAKQNENNQPSK